MRRNFTTPSPCKPHGWAKSDGSEKPSKVRVSPAIPTELCTAYPALIHRLLPAFHSPSVVNRASRRRGNSSRIHPDSGSQVRWNHALNAMREDGRTNKNGGKSNEEDHCRARSHDRDQRLCELSVSRGTPCVLDDLAV